MSTQLKHVSVSTAAHSTAKFVGELSNISRKATVLLFAALSCEMRVSPTTDLGKELVRAEFLDTFGHLRRWLTEMQEDAITLLVQEAGCDLGVFAEPTDIRDLGHDAVKGMSKPSHTVRAAERMMRNVAFTVDRRVLAIALTQTESLTMEQTMALNILSSTALPERFYFPVSYDYRGRMYYRGGILTPQGDDFMKGMLRFADEAPIGQHGLLAIELALADAIDLKVPKTEVREALGRLDLVGYANGEDGYQAAALACEYIDAKASGEYYDYMSGVVCHQDATCSGLQIAAAITGHRPTAEATNCTASSANEWRRDVYSEVSEIIAQSHTELGELCRTYGRAIVKKPVMTLGYGAGRKTLIRCVGEFLLKKGLTDVDPEDYKMDEQSQRVFMEALEAKCGATVSLLGTLQHVADLAATDEKTDSITWVTEDGFEAVQLKKSGEEVAIGKYKMQFDMSVDHSLQSTAITPNIVHSIDANIMRDAIRALPYETPVACVHDSLGTRACDYWAAGRAVRSAFVTAKPRETVERFCAGYGVELPLLGDYKPEEASQSSYFWC